MQWKKRSFQEETVNKNIVFRGNERSGPELYSRGSTNETHFLFVSKTGLRVLYSFGIQPIPEKRALIMFFFLYKKSSHFQTFSSIVQIINIIFLAKILKIKLFWQPPLPPYYNHF